LPLDARARPIHADHRPSSGQRFNVEALTIIAEVEGL
jgi:hypothetical protein